MESKKEFIITTIESELNAAVNAIAQRFNTPVALTVAVNPSLKALANAIFQTMYGEQELMEQAKIYSIAKPHTIINIYRHNGEITFTESDMTSMDGYEYLCHLLNGAVKKHGTPL